MMQWSVEIVQADIQAIQELIKKQDNHPVVKDRHVRNVLQPPLPVDEEMIWHSIIMCLITTQNKSGSGSAVDKFLNQRPFPLSLHKLRTLPDVDPYIEQVLSKIRIRRWKISTKCAQYNFQVLEQGGWQKVIDYQRELLSQRSQEPGSYHYKLEREATHAVQEILKGLGPKQSRNFWQYLGLTRYEIPLDSRVLRWIKVNLGFYVPSSGLSEEQFYSQVMDVIRELCLEAEILPCILDAAIFSSFEPN
jgi:hypothetical protein